MYQMKTNDRVVHPSVAATLTVQEVNGENVHCAWVEDKAVKMGVFAVDELVYAPDSVKGMAMAAVRAGFLETASAEAAETQ